jgi:hypothetical protein
MALGSSQPLTEMSIRNLPGGKKRPACKTNNLTALCVPIVYKMWEPRRLTILWASTACYRDSFYRPMIIIIIIIRMLPNCFPETRGTLEISLSTQVLCSVNITTECMRCHQCRI